MSDISKYALGIGFTADCNMKCSFCYSREKRSDTFEQPLKTWMDFIDNHADLISCINYGTGENAISDDWYSLVEHIGKNYENITQAVTTNGTLSVKCKQSPKYKEIITKYISEIDVSLDYSLGKKHDEFRMTLGAYEMAIDTLKFCQENKIQSTIVFMGVSDTLSLENVRGLFDIAWQYNAYIRLNIYRQVVNNNDFSPPELSEILKVLDWIEKKHTIVSLSDPFFSATCTDTQFHIDPSGKSSVRITQDGEIFPSTYLLLPQYRIGMITESFALHNISSQQIIQAIDQNEQPIECGDCEIWERCKGGAIDRRFLSARRLDVKDPLCPGPFRNGNRLRKYKVCKENFQSVHDEYLPTLFFKAKKADFNNEKL